MAVTIASVEAGSPASRAGIQAGEQLLTLNGHVIHDVLDYRFYETDAKVEVGLASPGGDTRTVVIRKSQYRPLGLEFTSYLMDQQRPCRNACIFCFVDQMPAGMRKTLYFKDDDTRMSFLFGNYVTLTNLSDWDVQRIIEMRISPINVSVHTTNPALRVKMMGNRFAGEVLSILPRLAQAGIRINTQCVLCPGINDGPELLRTLSDLERLLPALESVSLVPVGLTKFREGLPELRPYTRKRRGRSSIWRIASATGSGTNTAGARYTRRMNFIWPHSAPSRRRNFMRISASSKAAWGLWPVWKKNSPWLWKNGRSPRSRFPPPAG